MLAWMGGSRRKQQLSKDTEKRLPSRHGIPRKRLPDRGPLTSKPMNHLIEDCGSQTAQNANSTQIASGILNHESIKSDTHKDSDRGEQRTDRIQKCKAKREWTCLADSTHDGGVPSKAAKRSKMRQTASCTDPSFDLCVIHLDT